MIYTVNPKWLHDKSSSSSGSSSGSSSKWSQDENGYISYNPSVLEGIFGNFSDEDLYAIEYNTALDQRAEEMALYKEAQEANLANLQFNQNLQTDIFNANMQNQKFNQNLQTEAFNFNKNLATRQQNLAEESYYNGVRNHAAQLASLGINPAAQGGSLSGATMSGGSNVSAGSSPSASAGSVGGVPSGSPSMRTPNPYSGVAKKQLQLSMLSYLMDMSLKKQNMDIQRYDAETRRLSAESQIGVGSSTSSLNKANAEATRINNERERGNLDYLRSIGLTAQEWDTLDGLSISSSQASKISAGLGLAGIGNILSSSSEGSSSASISGSALFVLLKNSSGKDFSLRDFVVALNLSGETDSSFSGEVPYYYQRVLDQMSEHFNPDFGQQSTVNHIVSQAISENWKAKTLKEELVRTFNIQGW